MLLIRMGYKTLLVWRCHPQEEHIDKDETLLVGRGAQKKEQCRDEDVLLLIRIGNKTLLVRRCHPQEEHIEKDEQLLVGEVLKRRRNVKMQM